MHTLDYFFRSVFFWCSIFFLRLFFLRKITIMAGVSKLFPGQTDRMATKFFWLFFENEGSDDEKVRQKTTMIASVSKDSEKPKNRIGKKYFRSPIFFPKPTQARKHESKIRWISKTNLIWKELGLVVDIWWWYMAAVVVGYGYGSVVVYGYGFGAVVVGGRGDDDEASAAWQVMTRTRNSKRLDSKTSN